jgi:hypothetical protein
MRCSSSYWSIHWNWLQKPQFKTVTHIPHTLKSHFQLLTSVRSFCTKRIRKILCDSARCTYRNSAVVPIALITFCWFKGVLINTFISYSSIALDIPLSHTIHRGLALLTGVTQQIRAQHTVTDNYCTTGISRPYAQLLFIQPIGKPKLIKQKTVNQMFT